jgi:hypothetical protein
MGICRVQAGSQRGVPGLVATRSHDCCGAISNEWQLECVYTWPAGLLVKQQVCKTSGLICAELAAGPQQTHVDAMPYCMQRTSPILSVMIPTTTSPSAGTYLCSTDEYALAGGHHSTCTHCMATQAWHAQPMHPCMSMSHRFCRPSNHVCPDLFCLSTPDLTATMCSSWLTSPGPSRSCPDSGIASTVSPGTTTCWYTW